jgi:hypothetical protein
VSRQWILVPDQRQCYEEDKTVPITHGRRSELRQARRRSISHYQRLLMLSSFHHTEVS